MVARILAFAAGAFIAGTTLGSAVRVIVTPRGLPSRVARRVFLTLRRIFKLMMRGRPYEERDRIMAKYAPAALLSLLGAWLLMEIAGFTLMFWALQERSLRESFVLSGSSLTTLGFARPEDLPSSALAIGEALIGIILLALLISYLPSIYAAYSRREQQVVTLEVPAGYPPHPGELLVRMHQIGFLDRLPDTWREWEQWFMHVEETHTSFPSLPFFRSQQPYHSWITAAGVVLDAASLSTSALNRPADPEAELMLRTGATALRRLASFSRIPFDADPPPDAPISVERAEFDQIYDRLSSAGASLRERDLAWQAFVARRAQYDSVLVELCALVMAPPTAWSGDRLIKAGRPPGPADHRFIGYGKKLRGPGVR